MSLTPAQQRQTAAELQANFELSGLSTADLRQLTGWIQERIVATLTVDSADPADVWRLRDLLEAEVRSAGRKPVPYSVLTEQARFRQGVVRHLSALRWVTTGLPPIPALCEGLSRLATDFSPFCRRIRLSQGRTIGSRASAQPRLP